MAISRQSFVAYVSFAGRGTHRAISWVFFDHRVLVTCRRERHVRSDSTSRVLLRQGFMDALKKATNREHLSNQKFIESCQQPALVQEVIDTGLYGGNRAMPECTWTQVVNFCLVASSLIELKEPMPLTLRDLHQMVLRIKKGNAPADFTNFSFLVRKMFKDDPYYNQFAKLHIASAHTRSRAKDYIEFTAVAPGVL